MRDERNAELARSEADLELARERVASSMLALREEITRRTDWHEWVGRNPVTLVSVAFAVGFVLGQRR